MKINEILKKKKEEIKEAKALLPFNELKNVVADKQAAILQKSKDGSCNFLNALKNPVNDPEGGDSSLGRTRIIAEIKKSSPSKGMLRNNFNLEDIARSYRKHHAAAISVLTVRYGFNGNIEYLAKVKETADIPVLRKDFIFEEYQIYESRAFGADAILLIASILGERQLGEYIGLTKELGMDVLTEVHTLEDLEKAINCDSEIIGINNRDLKTFDVDINTTLSLMKEVPQGRIIVSESGIKTRNDIELLESSGVNAFLIGTTLMQSDDIGNELDKLLRL